MFVVMKCMFGDWETIATTSTIAEAIDARDTAFDAEWERAFDKWEFSAVVNRIDDGTTAIVRDNDTDDVWAAFAIREVSVPTI